MSLVEFELAVIAALLLAILLKPTTDPHRMQQIADRLEELNKQVDELLARREEIGTHEHVGDRERQN